MATAYGDKLWEPSEGRIRASRMRSFLDRVVSAHPSALPAPTYPELHKWSVAHPELFWGLLAEYLGIRWQRPPEAIYVAPPEGRMLGAQWFPGARLNFAENLLPAHVDGDSTCIIAHAEGAPRREISARALRSEVSRCAQALRAAGVTKGDRVAGVVANVPEALVAMLATASLGGVWAACSPDFGANAVVDRLSQVRPKVLFCTRSYQYNGKPFDCSATIREALSRLPSVERAVLVSHGKGEASPTGATHKIVGATTWESFLAPHDGARALAFESMRFEDPLYILFSSGTTGVPKCITHGVGGTLLQHEKELALHSDLGSNDRLLFYTTCGWMMWNWMASALSLGTTLVLYEGSVAHPDLSVLWRVVSDERVTVFGTSPKFISACMAQGVTPALAHAPRTILSTGAPLLPEHFAWIYEHVAGTGGDLHLASISGGTDIVSCFMLGNPLMPVHAGEIQYAGLGMAIDSWDESGKAVRGAKAELVCTRPFVSMPVGFWNDEDGAKYRKAYFEGFAASPAIAKAREVWRHGDFVEINERGGVVVYGRSDATLNPGGVRIGTAELYRQIETIPEVLDAIAVGHRDGAGDTDIVLFVKLRPELTLDASLTQKIKSTIRSSLTPRHVPKQVVQVKDVPYTRSGKKVEVAVTQAIHGEPVGNISAIGNPECMDEYFAFGKSR